MPRSFIQTDPKRINKITGVKTESHILEIATTNKNKLAEFQILLPEYEVVGVSLDIDEVQSTNPEEVAAKKAITAFEKNGNNPILVEDSSFDIKGLSDRPGPLTDFFTSDPAMRKKICEKWLVGESREATARAILAVYDGEEVFTFVGETHGIIADSPRGTNDFGYGDMFIPNGQKGKVQKTFAEMELTEKNKYSMRKKAVDAFIKSKIQLGSYTFELPEPFASELKRVQANKLNKNKYAVKFAYTLEAVAGNKPNTQFTAEYYKPIKKIETDFYDRYKLDEESASIGLVVTDIDKFNVKLAKNGEPIIWQMGPERRSLALAQRAEYFINNTDEKVIELIKRIEKGEFIAERSNRRHPAIETLMQIDFSDTSYYARAIKELGYKKQSSPKEVSRTKNARFGLFNKVGKYPRLMLGVGSMPAVSCWSDVILTAIIGHMPVFVARNNIFAGNGGERIKLINQTKKKLSGLGFGAQELEMYTRNIGAAIGSNPQEDVERARRLYGEAGVKLFRVYTINSDPRVVETATQLRKALGDEIEIFVGQITDKHAALELMEKANVDALIFGHGGGRQCTSATNGMALTTVEEIYAMTTDRTFNSVSLLVEGGIGRSVGALMVMGIDCILYNQQLTRGTIETGGIFLQNKNGKFGQPYHGSASAPTMIIEAANPKLTDVRLNFSGRTKVPEGKPGFTKYSEKANSMAFWIDDFKHQMARTMADLGVENVKELREVVGRSDKEILRIVSKEATDTSQAYGEK